MNLNQFQKELDKITNEEIVNEPISGWEQVKVFLLTIPVLVLSLVIFFFGTFFQLIKMPGKIVSTLTHKYAIERILKRKGIY